MSQNPQSLPGAPAGPKRASDIESDKTEQRLAAELLENTMPPTPLRELLAADGAGVCVLTNDGTLLSTVQQAGGERYPICPVESWQALAEAVKNRSCGIALLDADAVSGDLTDRLAELARLSPDLVPLVASGRQRAEELIHLLSERRIHRLLIKPPTVGITRLLLESSVSRYIAQRQRPAHVPIGDSRAASRFAGRPKWLLGGSLAAAIAAVVLFSGVLDTAMFGGSADSLPVVRSVDNAAPRGAATGSGSAGRSTGTAAEPGVEETAASAVQSAAAAPRDLEPASSGEAVAFEAPPAFAASAAEALPAIEDGSAAGGGTAGMPDSLPIDASFTRVEQALIDGELESAAALLDEIASLQPESSRLAFLRAQLERERDRLARVPAEPAAATVTPPQPSTAEPPSELASLIRIARARLAQEQLVAPPGDSALDYLTRAQALAPDSAAVSGLRAELGTAVVAAAQLELDRVNLDRAEELLVEAQSLGVTDEQLVALEIGLVYARETIARAEQDRILAQAQASLDAGHLFVPEEGSALAYLTEVRRLNPDHPRLAIELDALERALSAHVTNAIAAGNWARAAAGLGALDRSGADSGVLNGLRAELEFARAQERYLAEPSPASELNVVQFEPPVYPERALTRGTQGWVDLEFVVDVEGLPQNVVVTAAAPAGEFESAAVAAVSSYVYEPFERGGRTYARRVSLRVRFALQ